MFGFPFIRVLPFLLFRASCLWKFVKKSFAGIWSPEPNLDTRSKKALRKTRQRVQVQLRRGKTHDIAVHRGMAGLGVKPSRTLSASQPQMWSSGACMNWMQKRAVTPDARRASMHCEGKNAFGWAAYKLNAGAQRCDWLPAFHHKYQDYAAWQLIPRAVRPLSAHARSLLRPHAIGSDGWELPSGDLADECSLDTRPEASIT